MQVTIETINNKQCTVIRKPFDAEWVKEQLNMGIFPSVDLKCSKPLTGSVLCYKDSYFTYYDPQWNEIISFEKEMLELYSVITILPPLPRNPTPEDAPLLYRYMAEGLEPHASVVVNPRKYSGIEHSAGHGIINRMRLYRDTTFQITHATHNGERIEIAIKEKDNG